MQDQLDLVTLKFGLLPDGCMADELTPTSRRILADCRRLVDAGLMRRDGSVGPIEIFRTTETGAAVVEKATATVSH